ncbi:hypothetical protein HDV62DRAFT_37930 [Trichoderma sp. SZMC 28011]
MSFAMLIGSNRYSSGELVDVFKATDSFISSALSYFYLFLIYLVFFPLLVVFKRAIRSTEFDSSHPPVEIRPSAVSASPSLSISQYRLYLLLLQSHQEDETRQIMSIFPSRNHTKGKNHASFRIEAAYTGIMILSLQINTKSRHRYVCTFVTSRIPRPAL